MISDSVHSTLNPKTTCFKVRLVLSKGDISVGTLYELYKTKLLKNRKFCCRDK